MKRSLLALRLFLVFISFAFNFHVKAQTPYIKTSSGIGQYGYLEKDATSTMLLNSNTHANIYQLFSRTWLNGSNILTYGTAVNSCGGSNIDQTTNNYNFGASAVAGQIAYTSVHADYCGGSNSYGGNPNQTGFNERQHYIFDISDRPADLSASVNPVNGNNTVVMSVKVDFGTVSDRILQRFWIQNTGTMAESTDIANDGFKIYYEPATGSEVFNGTESSATLYGDYNSNSTSNNVYGHDALNIAIPSGGLRIYVVLNKFNNTCVGGKTVQVSLINDGLSFTPNMDTSFTLARVDQVPSSPTAITASSTLTGALNGTYNIPSACFPTVASAVTYLNTNGVSGPVVFNVAAGYTETAPAGGFALTATGTVANTITFQKSGAGANPTFTAPNPQTSGNLNDAIFKIIGGDYITIDGFTMQENAANTTTTAASNNMTEFGVALFYATTTNGCQNVTLKNNTITLNRSYQNTFGIYANSTHSATSMTVSATATGTTGGNHNLTITGNTISNVNQGISIIGPTAIADNNDNIVIGGSLANANTISNFGTTGTFSGYANVSGTVNGILVRNIKNLTISYNNITSSSFGVTSGTLNGIQIPSASNIPTATFTHNINNNAISLSSGNSASALYGIYVPSGSASTTSILNINNNSFYDFNCSVVATASLVLIYNASTHLTESISGNTFNNITARTTGAISFISNSYTAPANGSKTVQNNSVVTGFTRNAAGNAASFYGYYDYGSSPATVSHTISGNNFSNVNTGTSSNSLYIIAGISARDNLYNCIFNATNNTINNWSIGAGTGTFYGMQLDGFAGTSGSPNVVSGNSVSNITSLSTSTSQYGLYIGNMGYYVNVLNNTINNNAANGAAGQFVGIYGAGATNNYKFYNNTITNLSSSSTSALVGVFIAGGIQMDVYQNTINTFSSAANLWGIYVSGGTTVNIYNHKNSGTNYSIYGLSSSGASSTVEGIRIAGGTTINTYDNEIYNISSSGGTGPTVNGVDVSAGTTANAYRNKIYNIGRTGTATSGSVNGFLISGATTNIYNNNIGNITDTNSNLDNAVRGIAITSTTATTSHNIFHNSIYLTASSAGTNFGSSGIFHTFNTTATTSALNLRNNIIVNKSTANGTGKTVAFRRSAATNLNNFATTSNNNIFYAGTPSATNPIYYDGTTTQNTLADYKLAMATRDQNSYTEDVSFVSTTGSNADFLRIAAGTTTAAESSAPVIATPNINNDYWLVTRPFVSPVNGGDTSGTLCDIGASEFDGLQAKPSISFVSMTPSGNQCTNVARAIVVNVNPRGTLTAAPTLSYQVNGGAINNITMTAVTGTLTTTGTWTATIPTVTPSNGVVTWTVSATNGISNTYTGTSYVDEPLTGIVGTATANPTQICPSGAVNLSSNFGNSSAAATYTAPPAVTNATTDEDLGNVTITKGATTILNNTSAINVLVGTIGTATGTAGSYSNFTSFGPYNLTRGQSYNFSLSSLQGASPYSNSMAIYIDYNRDGDFNDAGENVYVAATTTSGAHTETGSFTVPATASYGQTRMRVICNEGIVTGPTMTVAYGEFEEYMLNIVPSFTTYQWSTASDFSNTIGSTQNLTGYTVTSVPSTYYVKATDASGCSVSTSVTVNSPAGMSGHTITPGSSSICNGSSTTLTQSITGGCPTLTYAWIVLSGPASHDGAFSNATIQNPSFTATVPGTYVLQCTITDASSATSVQTASVTVTNPQVTSSNATAVCGSGTSTLTATPSNVSNVLTWYTAATGGTVIGTGTSVTSPSISAATTYYVEEAVVGSGSIVTGSGTTNNSTSGITPLSQLYKSSHTQYLIKASDLSAAGLLPGNLTSLSFNVSTKSSTNAYTNYSISIGNSSLSALTGVVSTAGFTNVYSNVAYTSTVGTNLFTFSTPYNWDGSSNIIVDFCFGLNASYSNNDAVTGTTKSYNCTYGVYQDTASTCGATTATYNTGTSTYMPNFTIAGQVSSCKGSRVAVAVPYTTPPSHSVVTSDSTVCNNAVATLSVDSSTVSNYSTYIWYVGTVGTYTNLYQDAACTVAYTGQNLTTVYAKTATAGNVTYTCAASGAGCSSTSTVSVRTIPVATFSASPSSFCLTGGSTTISLSPTSDYTGATITWESSPDGVTYTPIVGQTTPTYTTTVSATTYYRVTIGVGASQCQQLTTVVNVVNPTVLTTTPATRCGAGTMTLGATGSAGTTLYWYDALTGGNLLGTGTSYVTPSISSTTNYYVEADAVGSGNVTIGTGASTTTATTQPSAFVNRWSSYRIQTIYTAAELSAAGLRPGNITAMTYNITSLGDAATNANYTVKIGATSLSVFGSTTWEATTGYTTVYPSSTYTHTSSGLQTINFSTPYVWDGTSNILIDITYSGANLTNNSLTKYTTTAGNTVLHSNTSGSGAATGTQSTSRLDLIFTGQIATCASSPRTTVTATVNPPAALTLSSTSSTICNGSTTSTVTITSNPSDYDTYVWTPSIGVSGDSSTGWTFNPAVSTNYILNATNSVSGCTNSATVSVTVLPSTATIVASGGVVFCNSGNPGTLSLTPSSGYGAATYQWYSSLDGTNYTPISSGGTSSTYTPGSISATTYYQVVVKDSSGNTCLQPSIMITVNNPTILTTTPATRCGTGTVTLGATANGSSVINWYAAATGGAILGTGTSFTTPSISANTTYYAEASAPGGNTNVGPASPTAEGGIIGVQTIQWDVNFTVLNSTTLNSVTIFPIASGQNGVITVRSGTGSSGTVLSTINYTTSVSGGATPQVIPINVSLSAGSYSLYTDTLPSSGINRNTSGASYPYTSSVANITGNGFDATYYMGLYNWNFASQCTSTRTPVLATVNTPPSFALSTGSATICSGNSTAPVTINTGASDYDTYTWSPNTNVSGNNISGWTFNPSSTTTYTLTASQSSGSLCSTSTTFTVTVNPVPTDVNITTPDSVVCPNTVQTLTATGGVQSITVLSENFNAASSWTTTNANNGGGTPANASWTLRPNAYYYYDSLFYGNNFYSNDNSQFYLSNSDSQAGTGNNTTSLLSPSFSTVGLTSATLSFYARFIPYTVSDHAYVDVSTDGGTSWTNAVANYTTALGSETYDTVSGNFIQNFSLVTLNLNSYVGYNNVKVRFRYVHNFGYWWAIDNVSVSGSAQQIIWSASPSSPNTIYTDLACTTPYNGTDYLSTVYVKPTVSPTTYTATSTLGSCPKSDNVTFSNLNTVWDGASWSSAPASNKSIEFQGNYTSAGSGAGNIQACSCTVTSGNVTIASGDTMTLLDDIKVNGGSMTFENNAQLLQTNNVANTGNITSKKNAVMKRLDYTYWGSPVSGQMLKAFSPGTLNSRFYTYNEPDDTFVSVADPTNTPFAQGKGYAIRASNGAASTPATFYGAFTGLPNNGNLSLALAYTDATHGYNLVANPYPSNIDFDVLYSNNSSNIYQTAYFWTNTFPNPSSQGSSYLGDNYAIYSGLGGVSGASTTTVGGKTPTNIISVGQGFIVKSKNTGNLNFVNSVRTSTSTIFINKNVDVKDRYWVKLISPVGNVNTLLIGYVPNATNDYDLDYDAERLTIGSDAFYSVLNNKKLGIQARDYPLNTSDIVQLGTKQAENGNYTFSLSNKEGIFANGQSIYLHDKTLGTYTDLQQGDYSFAASQGEQTDRFEITYKPGGTLDTGNSTKHGVRVYKSGEDVIIDADRPFIEVRLYDTSGRLIRVIKSGKNYLFIEKNKLISEINIFSIIFADETINKKVISN